MCHSVVAPSRVSHPREFEGRQQLRDEPAMVAVFGDHAPPPKLEGITEAIDLDEGDTEYEDAV
jgi:hypothetical protein